MKTYKITASIKISPNYNQATSAASDYLVDCDLNTSKQTKTASINQCKLN